MKHSKLDLIFSNSECVKTARIVDWNFSDHMAVMVTRKEVTMKTPKIEFVGRSYKNYVKEDFQEVLVNENWREFYSSQDPNKMWEIMEGIILKKVSEFCPLRSYKVNGCREPWITHEAIEAIKDTDRLLKKARISAKVEEWAEAKRV